MKILKCPKQLKTESVFDYMIEDGNKAKISENELNDNFYKKEFQTLWNYINHKYAYTVEFDSNELIKKSIAHINEKLFVSQLQYTASVGKQKKDMNAYVPETQFSIYKVDSEKVITEFFSENETPTIANIRTVLINNIEKILEEKKRCDSSFKIEYMGYLGIVFKTIHTPVWKDLLLQMLRNNELKQNDIQIDGLITNANVSYILFRICKESLFVMTGGYGSFYINKFIEKNYGLYLIPKILKKENPVVKNIIENNLTGIRASTHRTNRSNTSFISEQDLSSIYKQLNIEIDRDIATVIGVKFDEEESLKKKVNLINKDSLVIRRTLSLSNLSNILIKLEELEKKQDNFVLNYLMLAAKKGIKKSDLVNQLIENFKDNDYKAFILVGDDYENYVLNADKYWIIDDEDSIFIEQETPITLDDIFNEFHCQGKRLTKSFMSQFLKNWKIETRDRNGNRELYPQKIINTLQGFIEYGSSKQPCYLINGDWYVFDEVYGELLNKEYSELYELKNKDALSLKKKYKLNKSEANEDKYNKALEKESAIIVSHTALHQNVEIADAIFWDETTLYLMHNKGKFNGVGSRDLLNQILTSAEYLQKNRAIGNSDFLTGYYSNICNIRKVRELPQASDKEFVDLFNNRKICFIAGYLNGFKKKTSSTYAKYLTIETNKKLSDKGYEYIPMGIH